MVQASIHDWNLGSVLDSVQYNMYWMMAPLFGNNFEEHKEVFQKFAGVLAHLPTIEFPSHLWFHSFIAFCRTTAPPGCRSWSVAAVVVMTTDCHRGTSEPLICGSVVYSVPIKPAAWLMPNRVERESSLYR